MLTLTPTAAFWIDMLQRFDPWYDGLHWERSVRGLIEPVITTDDQLTDLVSEGIVIQQFLLELVTRRGLSRASVVTELKLLPSPAPAHPRPGSVPA